MTKLRSLAIVVLTTICSHLALADEERCSGITCDKCLKQKGCVWMHHSGCTEECASFPDINCYFPRMTGSPLTNRFEICEIERELHQDNRRCFNHTDHRTCRQEIGCVWLNGVTDSGKEAFWCSLLLESSVRHQHKHKNYPNHTEHHPERHPELPDDDEIHEFHASTASVVESLLGIYALLPFCFWGCWWTRALIRKSNGYEEHSVV